VRESYAQWVPVERAVALGDRVGLDLSASIADREDPVIQSKDAEYVVDPEGSQPAPGFADQLVGMNPGETKSFELTMPDDYRDKEVAGQPAQFEVSLHWVKERELPELDDTFAQQVGEYSDVAALRTAIEAQLRQTEDERVRDKLEEESLNKLVEISSIEFPPQLVDFQAQAMLDTFKSNVERQGLQLSQYLRLVGKDQETFEQEMREQAETRVRRSLALDAFADAEQIAAERDASDEASESRSLKALARLVEVATGDGRNGGQKVDAEKTADRSETSDTGRHTSDSDEPASTVSEEDQGTA
jgi:trigger factor